ncbi:MAG TPA: hypothetical protein VNU68_10730 [Verrucomicrobiae bacterium]|nr:hypothetical protein [Verrucomicrobiae bacterium]
MHGSSVHAWRSRLADFSELARRFLVILALGFWLGGFTFYAAVVIHTGHRVFGSVLETGFLTQRVTGWLNLSGLVALAILLWNAVASSVGSTASSRWRNSALWLTLALMLGIEAALFLIHPNLDKTLDTSAHRILARSQFHRLHLVYMNLSTVQWAAGLLHTLLILRIWRSADRTAMSGMKEALPSRSGQHPEKARFVEQDEGAVVRSTPKD